MTYIPISEVTKAQVAGRVDELSSVVLDGVDEDIQIPVGSPMHLERTTPWTVLMWAKRAAFNTQHRLFGNAASSGPFGWNFVANASNVLSINITNTSSGGNQIGVVSLNPVMNTTDWQLAGFTYDGSSLAAGVDGVVDGVAVAMAAPSTDNLSATIISNEKFKLGNNGFLASTLLNGRLGPFYFWAGTVLSAAQLLDVYNGAKFVDAFKVASLPDPTFQLMPKNIVHPTGFHLQGLAADPASAFNATLSNIEIADIGIDSP